MASLRHPNLIYPELIDPEKRAWVKHEIDIQESKVDTKHCTIWVPRPHTPAQKLARLHELGHVKYSPRDWDRRIVKVIRLCRLEGVDPDVNAVEKISKMLEENRIDWLLWSRHGIDLRPGREVLDWAKLPDPSSVLSALGITLQLAWTVWASRGLGAKSSVPNPPPTRTVDPDTGEYFDKAWSELISADEQLARAMIRGCMRMYQAPTQEMRDKVAAELASFFPREEEEKDEPPPPKKEEQEAQDEAEAEAEAHDEYMEKRATGVGSEVVTEGRIQYHDHTATVRRPSMRIARRTVPVPQGLGLRFPHRYFLDKAIFGQRLLTEAGIMIDGSGSMDWQDEDMQFLMSKLPAVRVGIYSSIHPMFNDRNESIVGRICTIAKDGRFAKFTGLDPEMSGGNSVDLEALWLLAKWPKPRLWLSDGFVCGGLHTGLAKKYPLIGAFSGGDGGLHEKVDAWMKQHDIYRVPTREVMYKLLKRQRVTLYRTSVAPVDCPNMQKFGYGEGYYPIPAEPISFQL